MTREIRVLNSIRVGDFLKTKLKDNEDLLLNKDKKVIDFINKYEEYLYTLSPQKIDYFFKNTGLIITHRIAIGDSAKEIIINSGGIFIHGVFHDDEKVYNAHLVIESALSNLDFSIKNNDVFIEEQKLCCMQNLRDEH